MKKIISLLLIAVMCFGFVACNVSTGSSESSDGSLSTLAPSLSNDGTKPEDSPSSSGNSTTKPNDSTSSSDNVTTKPNDSTSNSGGSIQNPTNTPFRIDLAGYVANIGNASALGIAKISSVSPAPATVQRSIEVKFLSATMFSEEESREPEIKDTESKNYIVMSTTEYGANTPEADETGLTKVSFTKTVTENVTTEITGTKYITASEGQISILAVEGFTYTVYQNGSVLFQALHDNDENDKDEQEGIIVLTELTDGTEYKVDYAGIGEETTVTQDELGGEIDKLYSVYGYTFISFVPVGMSARPTAADEQYDCFGVNMYDKSGYFSDNTRQSFVIDNRTGYVYAIENFSIDTIENGVIIANGYHYDIETQASGELTFSRIIMNETISVYGVFKDKYGTKYVYNDYIDGYDEANKTLYHRKPEYYLSDKGVAIYVQVDSIYNLADEWDIPKIYTSIKRIDGDIQKHDITQNESYQFALVPGSLKETDKARFMYIEDGYAYVYISTGGGYSRTTLSTMETECSFEGFVPYDYKTILIVIEGTLYYGDLWGSNAYQPGSTNNLVMLAPNCEIVKETMGQGLEKLRYRYTTFTETIFYKIISDENGNPKAVSETYVAPERNVITLQPLNR